MEFSTIKYKTASALQYLAATLITPPEQRHRVANCQSHIETKDHKFVLVRLSGKSMNGNEIEHVGGIVEKPLPLKNGLDLFNHLYQEMREEALIYKKDIKDNHLRLIIQSQRGAVNFIFKSKLNITSSELKERFKQKKNRDPDIKDLLFLKRDEYLDYFKNSGRSVKRLMVDMLD